MDGLDVCHVEDVDVNVSVGSRVHDLLLGLLGARRIPANEVNGSAAFRDFKRSLKKPK